MSSSAESKLQSELSARLRQARKAMGLLQDDFASRLGYQLATYRNYEQGLNLPPLPRLVEIAQALGVAVGWLITGNAESGECTPVETANNTAFIDLVTDRKLLERFRPSPEELLALLDESEKEVDLELLDIIGRLRDIRKGKKS